VIARAVARALAERFGTPLYAYDLEEVDARCAELRAILPADSQLLYSLKANPLPAVAEACRAAGCRAEVSSAGELAVALAAGFDPAQLLFTGPGKSDAELAAALRRGVGTFSAESLRDLERLSAADRVLLRVNPAAAPSAGLAMAGHASQFGFDEDVLGAAARWPGVTVGGLHMYLGTQVPGAEALARGFALALELADRHAGAIPMDVLDLGGGFPWPFASATAPADLAALGPRLSTLARGRAGTELWFESGRYLTASAGTLIARVTDVRCSRETTFVVLDAGISHLGGMSGLGRVLAPAATLVSLEPPRAGELVADVVGPLCSPLDCLARGAVLPPLAPGDLVAVPNAGAYGATASLTGFLSRPAAVEVSLRGRRITGVARLRGGHETVTGAIGALRDDERIPA
jgi:diaminopimelate decarboxylase